MDKESKIPIENIYYLLVYAWDCLEESEIVNVDSLDPTSLLDLLGSVLANGISHLLKRGLDRGYVAIEEETSSPRGRININKTIARLLHKKARLHCSYDELSYDVLHNQILKATIRLLVRSGKLSKDPHDTLSSHLRRFNDISDIAVSSSHFRRVQLHSNNHFYRFLMRICELIHDNLLISEESGEMKFRDFVRDEGKMAVLFENFVRNFYDHEQNTFAVKSEQLSWKLTSHSEESTRLLPQMRTDISLTSKTKKIIIDTKYYQKALTYYHGKESLHSGHLYQIRAYLQHTVHQDKTLEGILLYPTVTKSIASDYSDEDFTLKVRTINLAQEWRNISEELLGMISG